MSPVSTSFQEFETSAKVVELLVNYCGIPIENIFKNVGKTGVVAFIEVTIEIIICCGISEMNFFRITLRAERAGLA